MDFREKLRDKKHLFMNTTRMEKKCLVFLVFCLLTNKNVDPIPFGIKNFLITESPAGIFSITKALFTILVANVCNDNK